MNMQFQAQLPVPCDRPIVQPQHFTPQTPPHTPASFVVMQTLPPAALPVIASAMANYLTQRSNRDPVCMFVFNQQAQNNWYNSNWEQSVSLLYYYIAIAIESGMNSDFNTALTTAVQRYAQMLSAMAIGTYPQLRQGVSPQMVEQASRMMPEINQMMAQIEQRLAQNTQQVNTGYQPQMQMPQQMGGFQQNTSVWSPPGMQPGMASQNVNPWLAQQMPFQATAFQNQQMIQPRASAFQQPSTVQQPGGVFSNVGGVTAPNTGGYRTRTVNLAAEKYKNFKPEPLQPMPQAQPANAPLQDFSARHQATPAQAPAPQEPVAASIFDDNFFAFADEVFTQTDEGWRSMVLAVCSWQIDAGAQQANRWTPTRIQRSIPAANLRDEVLVAVETQASGVNTTPVFYLLCSPEEVNLDRKEMDRIRHQLLPMGFDDQKTSGDFESGLQSYRSRFTPAKAEPEEPEIPDNTLAEELLGNINQFTLSASSAEEAITMTKYVHEELKDETVRCSQGTISIVKSFVSTDDHLRFLKELGLCTSFAQVTGRMRKYVAGEAGAANQAFVRKLDRYLTQHLNDALKYNLSLPKLNVDSFMEDADKLVEPIAENFGDYFAKVLQANEENFIQTFLQATEHPDVKTKVLYENKADVDETVNDAQLFGLKQTIAVTYLDIFSEGFGIATPRDIPLTINYSSLPQLYRLLESVVEEVSDLHLARNIIVLKDDAVVEIVQSYVGPHDQKPYTIKFIA